MEQAIKTLQDKKAELKRKLKITQDFIEVTSVKYLTMDILDLGLRLEIELDDINNAIKTLQKYK